MTTPAHHADQATPAPYSPPPQARRSRRLPLILGAAGAAVVVAAAAVTAVLVFGGDSLDRDTAQRECRTALEREADERAGNLDNAADDAGVLVSVAGVDLQETWEIDNGWAVNATARYELTTAIIGSTPHTVSLTCEATTADGKVRTTVKNRS